jgi:hypothetical protein
MDKLDKIIEQVLEIKIEQPIDFKRIIKLFFDNPYLVDNIQYVSSVEELGYSNINEQDYKSVKSAFEKKLIECGTDKDWDTGDDINNGFDISSFKKMYTTTVDKETFILLTKF